jgi:nitrile hydratase accessory protein
MTEVEAFAEPWEARAFAMVRLLRDRHIVSAEEWTTALTAQITADDNGEVAYRHWLPALEQVLCEKGLVSDGDLGRYRTAWARAAFRTPHGEPIDLTANDFRE